jgi:hypothetical protein
MAKPLQPGDKVTYINEKQSGVVTRIISADLVTVDIGDGFEIPTPVKELVKITQQETKSVPPAKQQQESGKPPAAAPASLLKCLESGTISFAAVPAEINAVNTGPVAFILVNNSGSEFVFTSYALQHKSWFGLQRGVLTDKNTFELGVLSRNELMDVTSFLIQGHFFNPGKIESIATIRKEIPVLLPGFQDKLEGPEGIYAFARLFTIHQQGTVEPLEAQLLKEKFSAKDLRESNASGNQQKKKHGVDPDPDAILLTEKVIDLHIEELVPNAHQLSNAEMIQIQLKRFHAEMDQALRSHIKKIVFIHGVGNGTLKNAIRQELRSYPGVAFRDGNYFRYGSGATEIMINDK